MKKTLMTVCAVAVLGYVSSTYKKEEIQLQNAYVCDTSLLFSGKTHYEILYNGNRMTVDQKSLSLRPGDIVDLTMEATTLLGFCINNKVLEFEVNNKKDPEKPSLFEFFNR